MEATELSNVEPIPQPELAQIIPQATPESSQVTPPPQEQNTVTTAPAEQKNSIYSQLAAQVRTQFAYLEADRLARENGFIGGMPEAYHHHLANYQREQARFSTAGDVQARANIEALDDLWFKGRYADCLRLANHIFGKPQSSPVEELNATFLGGGKTVTAHPFESKMAYESAKRSPDAGERHRAELAWRNWLSSHRRDPQNPQMPYPPT